MNFENKANNFDEFDAGCTVSSRATKGMKREKEQLQSNLKVSKRLVFLSNDKNLEPVNVKQDII
jgi:hypothetical protein